VLDQSRLVTLTQPRRVHPEHRPAVAQQHVRAHPGADADPHPELFEALPSQRGRLVLAGLDLPTRKLPATRHFRRIGSGTRKYPAISDDGCANDDPWDSPFDVHGRQACQMSDRLGETRRPVGHETGELSTWTRRVVPSRLAGTKGNEEASIRPQAGNDAWEVAMRSRRGEHHADYLTDALSLLDGWTRDGREFKRTLPLDESQHAALTERIKVVADALQLRPQVRRQDGHTQIRLCTPDDGALSDGEVTLAARIEAMYRTIVHPA
jgi:4a-hydroxytetrahydrobiopterin dehydratase